MTTGGWTTYDHAVRSGDPSFSITWSGRVLGLSVVGNAAGHFDVDYVRLVAADTAGVLVARRRRRSTK